MKEIKFRAWDKVFKKMIVAGDSNLPDLTCNGCPIEPHTRKNLSMEMVLMQYTGLKDKNGKAIYDGDIIKQEWCGFKEEIGFISSGETIDDWTFNVIPESIEIRYGNLRLAIDSETCKIIGNVYENPELIK